jgi:hydroxymethylbilane synthase
MTQPHRPRLATRGSPLALAQSRIVAELLAARCPGLEVELVTVTTRGDERRDIPLAQLSGGDGVFTSGLERLLLEDRVDLAVHSLKDLPTEPSAGLELAAFPPRGAVHDVLIARRAGGLDALALGARVGTSSPRRAAQLAQQRPDLEAVPVRGNVDTRLRRLEEGAVDALILAAAGLDRLDVRPTFSQPLPIESFMPAAGQGALAVQCRAADRQTRDLLASIDDQPTRQAVTAERGFLRAVGGGCRVPIGVYGEVSGDELRLQAMLASSDGSEVRREAIVGSAKCHVELARALAGRLLAAAGPRFLAEVKGA